MIDTVKEWVGSIREDVETVKDVVGNAEVDRAARKLAAAALNYLVTRMDLVPDWEPTIGVIDDALVLRACMALASEHDVVKGLDAETLVAVGRLTNEADSISKLIGADLYAKLKKHCARLSDEPVRGRTPGHVVDDADARAALFREVGDELLRMPAATFAEPEAVKRQLTSYLKTKLD